MRKIKYVLPKYFKHQYILVKNQIIHNSIFKNFGFLQSPGPSACLLATYTTPK